MPNIQIDRQRIEIAPTNSEHPDVEEQAPMLRRTQSQVGLQIPVPKCQTMRSTAHTWRLPPRGTATMNQNETLVMVLKGTAHLTRGKNDVTVGEFGSFGLAHRTQTTVHNPSATESLEMAMFTLSEPQRKPSTQGRTTEAKLGEFNLDLNVVQPGGDTLIAPDKSTIRLHAEAPNRGGGLITASLPANSVSKPVYHKTVTEIWHIVAGKVDFWLQQPNHPGRFFKGLTPGSTLAIPVDHTFQFATGADNGFTAVVNTTPRWPGDGEFGHRPGGLGPWHVPGLAQEPVYSEDADPQRRG